MVLLIDGLGLAYTDSVVFELLPGRKESLATLLDNMRESIHAPHLQLLVSPRYEEQPSVLVEVARINFHIGSFTWFLRRISRTQQLQRKPHIIFNLHPMLNT